MRNAFHALQERRAEEALKLENLRCSIDEGLADLENGNYEEVDEAELDAWMDRVSEPGRP
jgi:antitoxin ParD1/3/4